MSLDSQLLTFIDGQADPVVLSEVESDRRPRLVVRPILVGAALLAAALVGVLWWRTGQLSEAPAAPVTTVQPGPTTPPTSVAPSSPPIDDIWLGEYESTRYGYEIGVLTGWTVVPADHDWTLSTDASDPFSTGQDSFVSPTGEVRVSAWTVPLDGGTTITEYSDIEAWVDQEYCPQADGAPCPDAADSAVPLCREYRDCHPTGVLVQFKDHVQAFVTADFRDSPDEMTIVAVWRSDTDPSVAAYGGARRLLEAYLSTMDLWTLDEMLRCDGAGRVQTATRWECSPYPDGP